MLKEESELRSSASDIEKFLELEFDCSYPMDNLSCGSIYGVGYIKTSEGKLSKVLLEKVSGGTLTLNVCLVDAVRLLRLEKAMNMVFVPALSKSFAELILNEKHQTLLDGLPKSDEGVILNTPVICCTIDGLVYNKAHKTITAKAKLFSKEHLQLLHYLSVQNDNWKRALTG